MLVDSCKSGNWNNAKTLGPLRTERSRTTSTVAKRYVSRGTKSKNEEFSERNAERERYGKGGWEATGWGEHGKKKKLHHCMKSVYLSAACEVGYGLVASQYQNDGG
mmetsp:Transcript_26987/g.46527  ORF Transcript_26987/g.46527 Transcript_26987/m.46527 type:complete len:106 (+) Transcript_26987:49-366(+)